MTTTRKKKAKKPTQIDQLKQTLRETLDRNTDLRERFEAHTRVIEALRAERKAVDDLNLKYQDRIRSLAEERDKLRIAARLARSSGYDVAEVASRLETVQRLQEQISKILRGLDERKVGSIDESIPQ